jgi:hypothetical protein
MDFDNPQQTVVDLEGIVFFSNFDSGNMSKAGKVGTNSVKFM